MIVTFFARVMLFGWVCWVSYHVCKLQYSAHNTDVTSPAAGLTDHRRLLGSKPRSDVIQVSAVYAHDATIASALSVQSVSASSAIVMSGVSAASFSGTAAHFNVTDTTTLISTEAIVFALAAQNLDIGNGALAVDANGTVNTKGSVRATAISTAFLATSGLNASAVTAVALTAMQLTTVSLSTSQLNINNGVLVVDSQGTLATSGGLRAANISVSNVFAGSVNATTVSAETVSTQQLTTQSLSSLQLDINHGMLLVDSSGTLTSRGGLQATNVSVTAVYATTVNASTLTAAQLALSDRLDANTLNVMSAYATTLRLNGDHASFAARTGHLLTNGHGSHWALPAFWQARPVATIVRPGYYAIAYDGRYFYTAPYVSVDAAITRIDSIVGISNVAAYTEFPLENIAACGTAAIHCQRYRTAVFTGRYLFLVSISSNFLIIRFDTTASFSSAESYSTMDISTSCVSCSFQRGGAFDGRYFYVPSPNPAQTVHLRVDTQAVFVAANALAGFNITSMLPAPIMAGWQVFQRCVFDGRYVWFTPYQSIFVIARYDSSTDAFTSASSWAVQDLQLDGNSNQFLDALFVSRYIYFVPSTTPRCIARLDTHAPLSTIPLQRFCVSIAGGKLFSAATDGRYIYFSPFDVGNTFLRYDSAMDFFSDASWQEALPAGVPQVDYIHALFDGRYVNFLSYTGNLARLDTLSRAAASDMAHLSVSASGESVATHAVLAPALKSGVAWVPVASDSRDATTTSRVENSWTDSAHWQQRPVSSLTQLPSTDSYLAALYDGRFMYFAPEGYMLLRYDTSTAFDSFASGIGFAAMDLRTIPACVPDITRCKLYGDGLYHNERIILIPQNTDQLLIIYNTRFEFSDVRGYSVLDLSSQCSHCSYTRACSDGTYVYMAPDVQMPGSVPISTALQIRISDGSVVAADITSVAALNSPALAPSAVQFIGSVFTGRYVVFIPRSGVMAIWDVMAVAFGTTSAWSLVSLGAGTYSNFVTDGRYVYMMPVTSGSTVLRVDTMCPFFAVAVLSSTIAGPLSAAVFDGRFIHMAPGALATVGYRYDTTQALVPVSGTAWQTNFWGVGRPAGLQFAYASGGFDGRYVYFVARGTYAVLRFDTGGVPSRGDFPSVQLFPFTRVLSGAGLAEVTASRGAGVFAGTFSGSLSSAPQVVAQFLFGLSGSVLTASVTGSVAFAGGSVVFAGPSSATGTSSVACSVILGGGTLMLSCSSPTVLAISAAYSLSVAFVLS
eukprot:TRINITY_DN4100_c0_g1_i1.p1 TRINITY_DN4100_c0_g1~~TRINITY_DN4100_c0_g1_i1.p1  ORF type:complete len:1242 (+),score=192.79 TRINITY_DN4100_c0_g1_i1:125-3850(+)